MLIVYECPVCHDRVELDGTDFVPGHDVCIPCRNEKRGIVRLSFVGEFHKEPLLWEGSD